MREPFAEAAATMRELVSTECSRAAAHDQWTIHLESRGELPPGGRNAIRERLASLAHIAGFMARLVPYEAEVRAMLDRPPKPPLPQGTTPVT